VNARQRLLAGAGALALASLGPSAQAQDAAAEPSTAYVGAEVGNTDTHRLLAGALLRWREHWNLGLQLARAEFELPVGDAASTLAGARLEYDFGTFGLGVGYRHGELEEASTTTGWNVGGTYDRGALRFSVEIESRTTSTEPTPFSEDLGPELGVQSGVSRCEVDSRGYQGQVELNRPSWVGFASVKTYDYQSFDCALTLDGNGNGPPLHARGRALGRRLGEQALAPVSGFASRLIPREAMLLDWSAALGVTVPIAAQWIGGAEIYRDVERVGDGAFDTGVLFASRRVNATWTLELSLGFSDADDVADTTFAGIRMSADL
jgi:hypothetical protein